MSYLNNFMNVLLPFLTEFFLPFVVTEQLVESMSHTSLRYKEELVLMHDNRSNLKVS